MNIRKGPKEFRHWRIAIMGAVILAVLAAYLANRRVTAYSLYIQGTKQAQIGEYEEAIRCFTRAIELETQYARAYYGRAMAYIDEHEYDQAIADLNRVIALANGPHAFAKRALAYYYKGRYEQAIRDCDSAIGVKADFARAYHINGLSLEKLGRTDEAVSAYKSCLKYSKPGKPPDPRMIRARIERLTRGTTTN